jgi:hypothetical protein
VVGPLIAVAVVVQSLVDDLVVGVVDEVGVVREEGMDGRRGR